MKLEIANIYIFGAKFMTSFSGQEIKFENKMDTISRNDIFYVHGKFHANKNMNINREFSTFLKTILSEFKIVVVEEKKRQLNY